MVRLAESAEGYGVGVSLVTESDAEEITELVHRNLSHLQGHMPWALDEPTTSADRRVMIKGWLADWKDGGDAVYAIRLEGESQIRGACGIHNRIGPRALEIGYWLSKDSEGMLIITRAAAIATGLAFELDDIESVEIHHDKANLKSGKVPERLGFTRISEAPDSATTRLAKKDLGVSVTWRMQRSAWNGYQLPEIWDPR